MHFTGLFFMSPSSFAGDVRPASWHQLQSAHFAAVLLPTMGERDSVSGTKFMRLLNVARIQFIPLGFMFLVKSLLPDHICKKIHKYAP